MFYYAAETFWHSGRMPAPRRSMDERARCFMHGRRRTIAAMRC
jgi:hypothetical protein